MAHYKWHVALKPLVVVIFVVVVAAVAIAKLKLEKLNNVIARFVQLDRMDFALYCTRTRCFLLWKKLQRCKIRSSSLSSSPYDKERKKERIKFNITSPH